MISAPPAAFQRPGANYYSNGSLAFPGNTTVVSAAANTTGLIVRTALLLAPASVFCGLYSDANILGGTYNNLMWNLPGPGLIIPPGKAFNLAASGAGCQAFITWDAI